MATLVDAITMNYRLYCSENNIYIGFEGEVVDIPHVELELFGPRDGVAAVALCPAGDAWTHVVAAGLLRAVEREVLRQQGARPNEGHVALDHVDELRQLVDRGGTHKAAHTGETLHVGEQSAIGGPLIGHGLELDDLKQPAMQAWPLLEEEGASPFVGKMEPHGHDKQQRAQAH